MVIFNNLTNMEAFNLTGSLPADRIEALLDKERMFSEMSDVVGCLQDAKANYPDEDFLQEPIKDLVVLSKNLRSHHKDYLLRAIELLEGIQQTVHNATEYGLEQIDVAMNSMKE